MWVRVLLASVVVLALALVAAGTAYVTHYSDRALPRTTVAGQPVAGLSPAELASTLQQRFDGVSVTLQPSTGPARQARLAELGYSLDVDATVAAAMVTNRTWSSYVSALARPRDVAAVVRADPERLQQVADSLVEEAGKVGSAARVTRAKDKESFVVVPAVIGQAVVMSALSDDVERAAHRLRSGVADVQLRDAEPEVTTAEARTLADRANEMVAKDVVVSDGADDHAASAAQKASWITVPANAASPGPPAVRAAKVRAWIESLAEESARTARDGLRNVSSTGRVLAVVTAARDGRVVTNAQEVADGVVAAMTSATDYEGEFRYRTIPASWTERRVAVGAEHLAYPAAEGEKWIDVNLSRHTMTAYVGGRAVKGPVAMVNGAPATPTVVGTFHIYYKNPLMTMRGPNADGTRYEVPDVPWSSFFHAGYALHGAPWRSTFGYAASHGCVNLPVDVAKWVYDWAPVGTPVVTHT